MTPASRRTAAQPPASAAADEAALAQVLALHRQGRLDAAEPLYRRLLQARPDDANLLHFHGLLLYQRRAVEAALAQVRRSIALDPGVAGWHNNLGNMLLAQGQIAEAAQAFRRCLALDPGNQPVRNNLASLLRQCGQLADAEALLRDALGRDPDDGDAWLHLAVVLAQTDRLDGAIEAGTRTLALRADQARTHHALALLYARHGRPDLAAQLLRHWLACSPGDARARHQLAAVTGEEVPPRAADDHVTALFDGLAASFESRLAGLGYQAPALCAGLVRQHLGPPSATLDVLDAGCGTGLCGPLLRPLARRLTGVDLSAGMMALARQRGGYDRLVQAELGAWMAGCGDRFDLVVSADTLCYFGAPQPVLAAARHASRPGGWLVFTTEALAGDEPAGHRLLPHGRYAHGAGAIDAWLCATGWQPAALHPAVLRHEGGQPVHGWLVAARAVQPPAT